MLSATRELRQRGCFWEQENVTSVVVGSLGKSGPFDTLPATAFNSHVLWRKDFVLLCLAGLLHDMADLSRDRWPARHCLRLGYPPQ